MDLAPLILAIDSDAYQDKLTTEEAVMALGWTGPLADVMAKLEGADPATANQPERVAIWAEFKASIG